MRSVALAFFFLIATPACGGASSDPSPSPSPAPTTPPPPAVAPPPTSTATTPPPAAEATPTVVHADAREIAALAIDVDAVYMTLVGDDGSGSVARWSKVDGAFAVLADAQPSPFGIVVAGDSIYWVDTKIGSGAVMKVARTGGTPETLATSDAPDSALVVRGNLIYYVDGRSDGMLRSVPTAGGASSPIAQLTGAVSLTSDGTDFFYLFDRVMKLPAAGGAATGVSETCFYPNELAVDATRAFWACQDGTVRSIDKAGGSSTKLFSRSVGGGNIGGLVLDDANVYFASQSDSTVNRVAKSGGSVATLATGVIAGALALDDAFVYFAVRGKTGGSTLQRIAK